MVKSQVLHLPPVMQHGYVAVDTLIHFFVDRVPSSLALKGFKYIVLSVQENIW